MFVPRLLQNSLPLSWMKSKRLRFGEPGPGGYFETIRRFSVPGFTLGHFWPGPGGIISAEGR